jgi:prepilin-type processing-associated H-X9-DG protein
MPIGFACPHCGAETDVAEAYAGRSGPCASCGETITVPAASSVARPATAKSTSAALVLGIVVGVCVLGVVVVCGGILVARLLPGIQSARQAARQTECRNNLQQIATAIFEYRQRYDTFPPPYLADHNGRPMHSWRVLILPFLGERALYARYRFDQPWDSPANRAVAETIPRVYRCPAAPAGSGCETSYMMIVGPRSFSTVTGPRRLGEFPDGAVGTLMLVETLDAGIDWAEPRDFEVQRMSFEINGPTGGGISSGHPGGAHAAMCDGSVLFLSEWTSAEEVRAMTTIDGGEKTGPD